MTGNNRPVDQRNRQATGEWGRPTAGGGPSPVNGAWSVPPRAALAQSKSSGPSYSGQGRPAGYPPPRPQPAPVPPAQRPGYVPARPVAGRTGPTAPLRPSRPPARPPQRSGLSQWGTRIVSGCFTVAALLVLVFFLAFAGVAVGYLLIARQLPPPEELQARQTTFVSSKIYDREGNLLYEVTDPQGGRRTYEPLERISIYAQQATIATEDRDFYAHPGFDPVAIARAFYYNFSEQRIVSGASTIPQQLARNLLLTPEERLQETAGRKIKEIVLATELTRTYPKDTILEIYLNEIYYGNLAYGIQAAAETYFGVSAADLTLAQASFLAGLPQSPATYDPFSGGYDLALARHRDVLSLMVEAGYIGQAEAGASQAEIAAYQFRAPRIDLETAPHFVVYVRQTLEGHLRAGGAISRHQPACLYNARPGHAGFGRTGSARRCGGAG